MLVVKEIMLVLHCCRCILVSCCDCIL